LLYPSPLPDLFSGEQLVLVGRYSDAAGGAVELTGKSGDKQRRFAEDVRFEAVSTDNEFIARLWATRRIGWLINEIRLRGESAELKDEVTTLAREHGIVTPYTAWLIVEDEQRRGVRPELQTLRQTPANRDALSYSESSFRNLSVQQSGADATMSARYGAKASQATVASPSTVPTDSLQTDERFMARYGLTDASSTSRYGGGAGRRIVGQHNTFNSAPAGPTSEPQALPSDLAKQSRAVDGKTFYQSGEEWVDAEIQKHPDAKRVKIEFNSSEYFDLMRKNTRFAKWATVGTKLQFHFDGTIYEIE
jgi:Ca-activated chloride channel family protein